MFDSAAIFNNHTQQFCTKKLRPSPTLLGQALNAYLGDPRKKRGQAVHGFASSERCSSY